MNISRLILNSALLLSILFFPWWVAVIVGIVSVIIQKNFYEIVGWGIFYDLLYGSRSGDFFGFSFFFTLGALVLLYATIFLKSKTRFQ